MMRILVPFGPLSPEKSLPVFPFFQTVTFLFVEEFLLQNPWYYPKFITTYLSVLLLHTSSHPSNLQLTNLFGNPKLTHLSAQQHSLSPRGGLNFPDFHIECKIHHAKLLSRAFDSDPPFWVKSLNS